MEKTYKMELTEKELKQLIKGRGKYTPRAKVCLGLLAFGFILMAAALSVTGGHLSVKIIPGMIVYLAGCGILYVEGEKFKKQVVTKVEEIKKRQGG